MRIIKVVNKNPSGKGQSGNVVDTKGIFPALSAGGNNPNRNRDIGWSSGYILVQNIKRENSGISGNNKKKKK